MMDPRLRGDDSKKNKGMTVRKTKTMKKSSKKQGMI